MMESRFMFMTAVVATVVLAVSGGVSGSEVPEPSAGPSAPGGSPAPPALEPVRAGCAAAGRAEYGRGCELLEAFFGRSLDSLANDRVKYELDVIIAILPDPYDSHLDWAHDMYLEAIRRAFESTGFVTDRFWLPTRRDTARVAEHWRLAREVQPGVVLLRDSKGADNSLRLLFTVSEVPTGGIYKEALRSALAQRQWLLTHDAFRRTSPAEPHDSIKIVGPVFSGSVPSLRMALDRWLAAHPDQRVRLISGAATDASNGPTLRENPAIDFSTTVHSDAQLDRVLHSVVLPALGIDAAEVAILRESSTQYGQSFTGAGGSLVIPFPMNIYSLRTEYARHPAAPANGQRPAATDERPNIPLTLQDSVRPRENPPVHSGLTAPVIDLILEEITRTIRTHNIRAIGIQATDVRDKLFLGDHLRRRVRDVQLFTYESNSLYLRADYNRSLRGMLVLSSYPLFLESQWWSAHGDPARRERLPFGTDGAVGVYNSTLMLLGATEKVVDYGLRPAKGQADGTTRPPVWITVVGRNSFLPLHAERIDSDLDFVAPGPKARSVDSRQNRTGGIRGQSGSREDRMPISFLAYGAWILLGLGITATSGTLLWWGRREQLEEDGDGSDVPRADAKTPPVDVPAEGTLYRQVERDSLLIHRQIYTGLLLFALAGLFLPTAVVVWKSLNRFEGLGPMWSLLSVLAIGIGVVAWGAALVQAAWQGMRAFREAEPRGRRYLRCMWRRALERDPAGVLWLLEVAGRSAVIIVGIGYFMLTLLYVSHVYALGAADTLEFSLFFHRAMQLDSGISPVVPLVLIGAGLAVWAVWHLQRIQLLTTGRTPYEEACLGPAAAWRDRGPEDPTKERTADETCQKRHGDEVHLVEGVRRRLFRLIPHPQGAVLALFMALIGGWLWFHFGGTLEDLLPGATSPWPVFDLLLSFGLLAALGATVWAVYRFVSVWRALERFLNSIEESELRTAFERLPPQIARLTRLTLQDPPARSTVHGAEETHWKHLRRIFEEKRDDLYGLDRGLQDRVEAVSRSGSTAVPADPTRRRTKADLASRAQALRDLHDLLRDLWQNEPTEADIKRVADELTAPSASGDSKKDAVEKSNTSSRLRRSYAGRLGLWLRVAEELLAVAVVDYIEWVLRHLRRLALFLLLSLLLTTMLFSSYPYPGQGIVKLLYFFLLAATLAALILVINQISRNDLLSRITRTDPGRVTWDFTYVSNLLLFVGIPLLAAVSAEFPEVRQVLFAWVEPLLRTITKV